MANPNIQYIILTQQEADTLGKMQLDDFEELNPYAGPLKDGTYALPRVDILTEYAKNGVLGQIESKLDIASLPHSKVAEDEWDHSSWGPPPAP